MVAMSPKVTVSLITNDDVAEVAALSRVRTSPSGASVPQFFWADIAKKTRTGRGGLLGFVARDRNSDVVGYAVASYIRGLRAWLIIEPDCAAGVPELIKSAVEHVGKLRRCSRLIAMLKTQPINLIEELGFTSCARNFGLTMANYSTHMLCRRRQAA